MMRTGNYLSIAIMSYCPIFWVMTTVYIMFIIPEGRRGHLLTIPIPGIVLLWVAIFLTLLQALFVTIVTRITFRVLSKYKASQATKLTICGLILTYWYAPLTIPALLGIISREGFFAELVWLNMLGVIISGIIFFFLPTISYLIVLRKRQLIVMNVENIEQQARTISHPSSTDG